MIAAARSMKRLMLLLALALPASGSLSGCSWIFVKPLPDGYRPGDDAHCTTSRTAPVVDTILATTNLVSAAYVASEDKVTNKGTAVALSLAAGGLWFGSAIYGYLHTSDCEAAKADEDGTPHHSRRPLAVTPAFPRPSAVASAGKPAPQQDSSDEPGVRPDPAP
jgi:hypothetical protein